MQEDRADTPAREAQRLMRALDRATLATSLDGWPYASLVLTAADHDAAPLLLISDLAEHTKNLRRDPHVSLLFDGTAGHADPLTGPRVTVLGEIQPCDEPRLKTRFIARHAAAALYAGFGDFHFYRLAVSRAHLVAGFGRIHWIAADHLLFPAPPAALAAAEPEIVRHMNEEHADTVRLYAHKLLGGTGEGWRLTGLDPEGVDLRQDNTRARLDFAQPVSDAEGARAELVRLAAAARRAI